MSRVLGASIALWALWRAWCSRHEPPPLRFGPGVAIEIAGDLDEFVRLRNLMREEALRYRVDRHASGSHVSVWPGWLS